jgi:hypothetical protein
MLPTSAGTGTFGDNRGCPHRAHNGSVRGTIRDVQDEQTSVFELPSASRQHAQAAGSTRSTKPRKIVAAKFDSAAFAGVSMDAARVTDRAVTSRDDPLTTPRELRPIATWMRDRAPCETIVRTPPRPAR